MLADHCTCIVFPPYNREIFLCIHVSIKNEKLKEAQASKNILGLLFVERCSPTCLGAYSGYKGSFCPADPPFRALPGPRGSERVRAMVHWLQCLCGGRPRLPQWAVRGLPWAASGPLGAWFKYSQICTVRRAKRLTATGVCG